MEIKKVNYVEFTRRKNNLTQVEFSKMLGVAQSTISKVEKGVYLPDFKLLVALREKFKMNPYKIIKNCGMDQIYELPRK